MCSIDDFLVVILLYSRLKLGMEDMHREKILSNIERLVSNTSDIQFEKLLSRIYSEKIINDHMLQKIQGVEDVNERKEYFFKMITKRGPTAFKALINNLYNVGLGPLSELLKSNRLLKNCNSEDIAYNDTLDGLCLGRPTSPTHEINENYEISSSPRGLVLIINIKRFDQRPDITRGGSDVDVEELKKMWKGLNYDVAVTENTRNARDFENTIKEFVGCEEMNSVSCAYLFIMTHGKANPNSDRIIDLQMKDNSYVNSEWVIEQFNSVNCKGLVNKPKVIVFQACRGCDADVGVAVELDHISPTSNKRQIVITPTTSDLLVVYSTLPGQVSQRHSVEGSFLVQDLCYVIKERIKKSDDLEIINILKMVSQRLQDRHNTSGRHFQILHWESLGFSKNMYLS